MNPSSLFCLLLLFCFVSLTIAKYNKVCVYTIAKNEAKHIDRFAESAKKADLVLVVDTGSQDNTVELLKKRNITVVEKVFNPWRFDTARNFALDSLPEDCEICVWQDLDEVLTPDDWPDRLRAHFEDTNVNNALVHFVYPNSFDYWRYKAHRRHGFHYKYAVHEIFTTDPGVEMKSIYADDITILHLVDSTKARNYIPLLEILIAEYPNEVPSHTFWLARDYYFTNQFQKAVQTFEKYLNLNNSHWGPERAASCSYIAEALWRLITEKDVNAESEKELKQYFLALRAKDAKKGDQSHKKFEGDQLTGEELMYRIEQWFIRAVNEAPEYRDPLLSLANWYIVQSEWDKAWDRIIASLHILERDPIYLVTERAWSFGPYADLARVLVGNQSLARVFNSDLNGETIYQILYQVGAAYSDLGRWPEAQEQLLESWNYAVYHLEPLYRLMEHYYFAQSYQLAYMYGLQGIGLVDQYHRDLSQPTSWRKAFYHDEEIYQYKYFDVFSVVCGWIGDYENGKEAARRAYENAPEKDSERILKNFKLYDNFLKDVAATKANDQKQNDQKQNDPSKRRRPPPPDASTYVPKFE